MKKYRLKELHQKYINEVTGLDLKFGEMPLEEWNLAGYNIQALEEVPSRIELNIVRYIHSDSCNLLRKNNGDDFTNQEKDLCEKALNGELFTKDDMEAFVNYSRRVDNINSPTNMLIKDFLRMNNDTYQNNT